MRPKRNSTLQTYPGPKTNWQKVDERLKSGGEALAGHTNGRPNKAPEAHPILLISPSFL